MFFGSLCCEGEATGVVLSIGDATDGSHQPSGRRDEAHDALQVEVDRFVIIILVLILITGGVSVLVWGVWGKKAYPNWMVSISEGRR